jgi:hypothetical protein
LGNSREEFWKLPKSLDISGRQRHRCRDEGGRTLPRAIRKARVGLLAHQSRTFKVEKLEGSLP